jgi:hypothetical protein
VAEDHRTAFECGMSLWERATRGVKGFGGAWKRSTGCLAPRCGVAFASQRCQPGALRQT